jgi:hypothetical protein
MCVSVCDEERSKSDLGSSWEEASGSSLLEWNFIVVIDSF